MHAQNFEKLKTSTSDEFEQKALRLTEALDDFKILQLPEGQTSIVKVEDVSEDEKKVTVTVGTSKRRLLYKLTKDGGTNKWVVDDIFVKQKHEGLTSVKSVTEQMDLLLRVREFLAAWDNGERSDVLAVAAPELRRELKELPPIYLARLTRRIVGKKPRTSKLKPNAQMYEDVAVVRLPRTTGEMVISLKLLGGAWKVADLALQSADEGERIPSLVKLATAMRTAMTFLKAYRAGDKQALSEVCSKKLFQGSLAHADLRTVELPAGEMSHDDLQLKMQGQRADLVIPGDSELVTISLKHTDRKSDADTPAKYEIEDVTIYELDGTHQQKRLSLLFTAHAMMRIFSRSLVERDLSTLRKTSTADFNRRIWKNLDEADIRELPLSEIEDAQPEVLSTAFRGALTEITVMQGERALTYVLRDRSGEVRVDDVLVPVAGRPNSLKTTLELLLPIRRFAVAVGLSRIDALQRTSSNDFNRLVWTQTDNIPGIAYTVPKYLGAPLKSIEQGETNVLVTFGDEQWGARVLLVQEHGHHVVDEVLLIAGPEPHQRARLKHTMQIQLANGPMPATVDVPPLTDQLEASPQRQERAAEPQPSPSARIEPQVTEPVAIEPAADAFTTPPDEAEPPPKSPAR